MERFEKCFSYDSIVRELCKARIKVATDRHDALFLHNMFPASDNQEAVSAKRWGSVPSDIFPPRRQWHRFRSRHRGGKPAAELNQEALINAIKILRKTSPEIQWVRKLDEAVANIQQRVLRSDTFIFSRPEIRFLRKSPDTPEYRPSS
jgi:hypothetical protein